MQRVPFFSKFLEKVLFELNNVIYKRIYKEFIFHADTKPLETNPSLGAGNGHALSRDFHLLIPQLLILRLLGCKTFIDLGSGDGFVLRIAKKIRFTNLYGVEANADLVEISHLNLQRSKIFESYFQDFDPAGIELPIDVVYIFNPDLNEIVESLLYKMLPLSCHYYLTKNLQFSSNALTQLDVGLVWRLRGYSLYKTKGKK